MQTFLNVEIFILNLCLQDVYNLQPWFTTAFQQPNLVCLVDVFDKFKQRY